jgi:hypothetical protein
MKIFKYLKTGKEAFPFLVFSIIYNIIIYNKKGESLNDI